MTAATILPEQQQQQEPESVLRKASRQFTAAIPRRRRSSTAAVNKRERYLALERQQAAEAAQAADAAVAARKAARRRSSGVSLTQPAGTPANAHSSGHDTPVEQATLTENKKPRLSLRFVGAGFNQYMQSKVLLSAERLAPARVFEVMETLSETLIFKSACPEERILLAHRLR